MNKSKTFESDFASSVALLTAAGPQFELTLILLFFLYVRTNEADQKFETLSAVFKTLRRDDPTVKLIVDRLATSKTNTQTHN